MADGQSMTVADIVAQVRDGRLEDFVREAVALVARELMEAEISGEIGAALGEVAPESRLTHRNGYRPRASETRVGEVELLIPKKRQGPSYFPSFLEPRRRSEQAIVAVVLEAYVNGVSTRKVDRLVEHLAAQHAGSQTRQLGLGSARPKVTPESVGRLPKLDNFGDDAVLTRPAAPSSPRHLLATCQPLLRSSTSKDHNSLAVPTGPFSRCCECPAAKSRLATHAWKSCSERQRVSTRQTSRSSFGRRSSNPSNRTASSTLPARAANRCSKSAKRSRGTVIALILTTLTRGSYDTRVARTR